VPLSPLFQRYEQVILDLDGCVWVGPDPLPGAADAIAALRDGGKRVAFVTNDPRHAGEEFVQKLWGIGVQASLADVVTVGAAVHHLLAETRRAGTAFVIGTDALRRHVADAGVRIVNHTDLASRAELVIVGGTDDFVFDDLKNAVLALRRGADFLATGRDATYPMPEGLWPGTGALLAAVEVGSGRSAAIVGKPEPQLFFTALDRLGDGPTLVIGDRLDADIAAAEKARLDSALVLTGGTSRTEAEAAAAAGAGAPKKPKPLVVADSLAALVNGEHG
jgi:HAD superfamily hydrolase (TIGR01450 family)